MNSRNRINEIEYSYQYSLGIRLATSGIAIVAEICNPVRVFSNRHPQFLGHMVNESCEKVNVFDKNVCILHSHNARALELAIFQIKVEFPTTLGLSLIPPVDRLASFRVEWNGNDGTLAEWLCLETVNDVGNLGRHLQDTVDTMLERTFRQATWEISHTYTVAIVSLRSASFRELILIGFFLSIVPAHVLGSVVDKRALWKELGFPVESSKQAGLERKTAARTLT